MSLWTAYGTPHDTEAQARRVATSLVRFYRAVKVVKWGNKWIVYFFGRLREAV